jgi:hypothetical protein
MRKLQLKSRLSKNPGGLVVPFSKFYLCLTIFISTCSYAVDSAPILPTMSSAGGGSILPAGKLKFAYKNISFKRDDLFNDSHEVSNAQKLDGKFTMQVFVAKYGIQSGLDVRLAIPHKSIRATAQLGGNNAEVDNSGIGDAVVMFRHALNDKKRDGYLLSVGLGVKLPTGSTSDDFKVAPIFAQGIDTPLASQMGTGEFEYKAELGITKVLPGLRLDAHSMFTLRPKAKNDFDFGNEFALNLSVVKRVYPKINLGFEYNGKYNSGTALAEDTNAAIRANLPVKPFSGTVGYVTPQIQFVPFGKPKVHLDVGVALLAHYELRDVQPLERSRLIIRLGYLF